MSQEQMGRNILDSRISHTTPASQRVMLPHSTHSAGTHLTGDKTQIERQRNAGVEIFIVGTHNPSDT